MTQDFISLSVIVSIAFICPLLVRLIPNKLVPETVFLLIAGALLGPSSAGLIYVSDSIDLLSDLGLAFLFLLAGFEINPKSLTGTQGKCGCITWIISFALAFIITSFFPSLKDNHLEHIAMSIALCTTALGALMPILKERGLSGSLVGERILAYGTWGELCPIFAMALLLSTRAELKTLAILAAFFLLCLLSAIVPAYARKAGHKIFEFLTSNAETTSQTMVRATVFLLVVLVAFSSIFDLDIVLGSFAAGFILRYIIPEGNDSLEKKLEGIGYGFLIPLFFIVSGAKINLSAVFGHFNLMLGFIVLLLLVRTIPIIIAQCFGKEAQNLSIHNRITVALYCTTALPLIVAVTSVAVNTGAMSQEIASVLVASGAITVFLMPLLASVTYRVADTHPLEAAREIAHHPSQVKRIIKEHLELEHMMARQDAASRRAARKSKVLYGEIPWNEAAFSLQRKSERKRARDEALDAAVQEAAVRGFVPDAQGGEQPNENTLEDMDKDRGNGTPKGTPKDTSKGTPKDTSKGTSKDQASKETNPEQARRIQIAKRALAQYERRSAERRKRS